MLDPTHSAQRLTSVCSVFLRNLKSKTTAKWLHVQRLSSPSFKHHSWRFVSTLNSRAIAILNLWEFPWLLNVYWLLNILNENCSSEGSSLCSEIQFNLNCRYLNSHSEVPRSRKCHLTLDIFWILQKSQRLTILGEIHF